MVAEQFVGTIYQIDFHRVVHLNDQGIEFDASILSSRVSCQNGVKVSPVYVICVQNNPVCAGVERGAPFFHAFARDSVFRL